MLPSNLTQMFPYIGSLFFLLAVIFEIIAAADTPNVGKPSTDDGSHVSNMYRFHNLALIFAIVGIGMFVAPH